MIWRRRQRKISAVHATGRHIELLVLSSKHLWRPRQEMNECIKFIKS